MKKVSQNTKNEANKAVHSTVPRSEKDFVILCPSAADSLLVQAALYFLPANYKLRVLTETFQDILPFSDDQAIMKRISFGSKTELSDAAVPSSNVHAVIYSEPAVMSESAAPRVVISKALDKEMENTGKGGFTVPFDSPEAVASAMLRIARTVRA